MSERRQGIQSVGTGMRVLTALAATGEATLGAVAAEAGLSPPQAHRYLSSLVGSGMARQDPASGRYDLGPEAIRVGLAALARNDLFARADPAVAAFTRETGRTALIAVHGPDGPTVVRWHPGAPMVITSLALGSVLPWRESATGQVFLAWMEGPAVAALGQDAAAPFRAEVRAALAAHTEALIPGLRASSVPVFDLQGRVALVVTSIATAAFSRVQDAGMLKALQRACREITKAMGGAWPA